MAEESLAHMGDRRTGLERWLLGLAQIIIAAMLLALYTKMDDLGVSMAVVQSQVSDMRASEQGYYTTREAEKRHEEIFRTQQHQYGLIEDHEQRLRKLETLKR